MSENQSKPKSLVERDAEVVIRPWNGTDEPVPVVRASGCVIEDEDGNEFLDFTAGYFVNNAGHCHPKVMAAATEQMSKVTQVSGRHTTEAAINLAERLVSKTPKTLEKVFFATGGSEANENAYKMARQHTGKKTIASLENGYHGLTLGVLPNCAAKKYRDTAGIPMEDYALRLPTPYCYRCKYVDNCETQCLTEAEEVIEQSGEVGKDIAAFIAEPIQAVGGVIPPKKWWAGMDKLRKDRGMLLILDEIQTGMGRTGKMFALEHYDLEPDILTAGKGLSGGVGSLAAALSGGELANNYIGGTTPTSAGNAVSAAAGVALYDVLLEEGHVDNAAAMGKYFTKEVEALNDPWVGDVRFQGLLGGVELVADRDSKEPLAKTHMQAIKAKLFRAGMLITTSGLLGNVLRLQPPLCISAEQLDGFIVELDKALKAVRSGG